MQNLNRNSPKNNSTAAEALTVWNVATDEERVELSSELIRKKNAYI